MPEDLNNIAKQKLRDQILNKMRAQKPEDRLDKSRMIEEKLLALPGFQAAEIVLFYASFDGEVDTYNMMKQSLQLGKKIALPIIDKKSKQIIPAFINNLQQDLVVGPYGIDEPRFEKKRLADCQKIDLAVVPGIAFDHANFRLGRGAGFYDRFLSRISNNIPSIGLAYDFQIVNNLPHQKHDVPLTQVLSN